MIGKPGDRIVVESEKVGSPAREGTILEVIESKASTRYRVRWDAGHETTFLPYAGSARVVPGPTADPASTAEPAPTGSGRSR
jgi:Domain of unknown function (DUF1918)